MTESAFAQSAVQLILLALVILLIPASYRVVAGPALPGRLAAVDLITTLLIGIIVMLALVEGTQVFVDMAIALAAFAFIGTISIARYISEGRVFLMLLDCLGVAALVFGLFFCAVGVLGVIRMPDTMTRLHASGKVATLGLFGLLLGAALLIPSTGLRLLALGLFVLLTSPVATHAIAASDYRRREIIQELGKIEEHPLDEADVSDVDVTAVLSRPRIQDIIEAQERALRHHTPDSRISGEK